MKPVTGVFYSSFGQNKLNSVGTHTLSSLLQSPSGNVTDVSHMHVRRLRPRPGVYNLTSP